MRPLPYPAFVVPGVDAVMEIWQMAGAAAEFHLTTDEMYKKNNQELKT